MALTEGRNTPERDGVSFEFDVAAATEIFEGSLVALDASGNAVPMPEAAGKIAAGRCEEYVDNPGNAGDEKVKVKSGVFRFENSAGVDEITKAQIGDSCFGVDDQTVAKTVGGGRSIAGYIVDVDDDGVWVKVHPIQSADGDVVAANNLSDVVAATARANLGANKVVESVQAADLVAADAKLYGIISPVAGTIVKIYSVLKGHALAAGDCTLTGKIGGVAITTGVITITQAGSAIGDKDNCTPNANNVVAAGDEIQFLVGGANTDTAAFAQISLLIAT